MPSQQTTNAKNVTLDKPPARDKYSKMLNYLKCKQYDKFVKFLNAHDFDIDHTYDSPDNGTLLDIACRSVGNSNFVDVLIRHNASVNAINPVFGKAPIHNVVQNDDLETLRVLLQNAENNKCDPHVQDKYGNCVLHFAAVRKNANTVKLLLEHLDPDIVAWKLVDRALIDLVEFQTSSEIREVLRKVIHHNPTERLFGYLYNGETERFIQRVVYLEGRMGKDFLYDNDGCYTYMQYACNAGLGDVVIALLNLAVDPNHYWQMNPMNPLMMAAFQGYYRFVEVLLKNPNISFNAIGQHNVLHCLFYGMFMSRNSKPMDGQSNEPRDYSLCLEHIRKKAIAHDRLDVNSPDEKGYTALHYAVQLNHKPSIKMLIDAGADVCQKNCNGETPLSLIHPNTLQDYLDSCISCNEVHCGDKNHIVIFRYNMFTPQTRKSSAHRRRQQTKYTQKAPDRDNDRDGISEIGPLLAMRKIPQLKKLLEHPVVMSFVTLKWHVVKKLYYYNLLFYVAFLAAITWYVYLTHDAQYPKHKYWLQGLKTKVEKFPCQLEELGRSINHSVESIDSTAPAHYAIKHIRDNYEELRQKSLQMFENFSQLYQNVSNESGLDNKRNRGKNRPFIEYFTCSITILLLIPLCIRELIRITIYPVKYVRSMENWLILVSILSIVSYLLPSSNGYEWHDILASTTIFTAWLGLIAMLGRQPSLSINQEMFKTVMCSFLKFTYWFLFLIIAYLLSLHVRFKPIYEKNEFYGKFIYNPVLTAFQSFVSVFGQTHTTQADKIPQNVSEFVYITLITAMSIVLFNLLNGLAVDDVKRIRTEAKLLKTVSRIEFISYVETMVINVPTSYWNLLNTLTCGMMRKRVEKFHEGLNLFPYIFSDRTVHVSPNFANQVVYATTDENRPNEGPYMVFSRWRLDSQIVKNAMKIYEKRLRPESEINFDSLIAKITQQQESLEARILEALQKQNHRQGYEMADTLKLK